MIDIWEACRARIAPAAIRNRLIRIVESQEQIATNHLVETFEEQELLEQLLDDTKPALPASNSPRHYLLLTPFRYPPLKYGSRFGSRFEPSLFYGSLALSTAFAETAYYRFLFWLGMTVPPATGRFLTQHTLFGVEYASKRGLQLQQPPFSDYAETLMHPYDYTATQRLGRSMREHQIEAFEFCSARDAERGLNAALFIPDALASDQPLYQQQWICDTDSQRVSFYSSEDKSVYSFELQNFMVEGRFPEVAG